MRTDAWYNYHFWWWDIRSWLCHFKILKCKSCKEADEYNDD